MRILLTALLTAVFLVSAAGTAFARGNENNPNSFVFLNDDGVTCSDLPPGFASQQSGAVLGTAVLNFFNKAMGVEFAGLFIALDLGLAAFPDCDPSLADLFGPPGP